MRGRKRRRRRRKGPADTNRRAIAAILCVVLILLIVLTVEGHELQKRIDENDETRAALESGLEEEKARTESIESLREYMQSDEFVREEAREHLGLVDSDEVILKPEENAG